MTFPRTTWLRPPVAASLLSRTTNDQNALSGAMREIALPDGRTVRVLDCGTGDAVVMLPMITELNFVYASQIADLQTDHRVVAYEPLLCADANVGIADRADEVRGVLAALGIPRAHIIAWSDTGSVAYHLARTRPEVCRSLTFIGLADRYRFPRPYGLLLTMLQRLPIERLVPSRVLATVLGRFLGGTQIKPEWIVEGAVRVPRLSALFKHSIAPNLTEHRPRPEEVWTPSLVIVGEHDRVAPVARVRRMAALLPNAGAAVIVHGGEHFVQYVDDALVNAELRRFLATVV
jgi:pimeloyl-ACP methyl ester carboxylesterase